MNPSNPASATLVLLADMLERPLQTKYCSSCPVRKDVLAEALLDYAFFSRKARYVENATPFRPSVLSLSRVRYQKVNRPVHDRLLRVVCFQNSFLLLPPFLVA